MGDRQEAVRRLQDCILEDPFELRFPMVPECGRFDETCRNLAGRQGVIGSEMTGEMVRAIEAKEITRSGIERLKRSAAVNSAVFRPNATGAAAPIFGC